MSRRMGTAVVIVDAAPPVEMLEALAERINTEHAKCEASYRAGIEHALACGTALIEAKSKVKHGEWADWLAKHCTVTQRQCQRYVQVAKAWPKIEAANATRVAGLSIRSALDLTSRGAASLAKVDADLQTKAIDFAEQEGLRVDRLCQAKRRVEWEGRCREMELKATKEHNMQWLDFPGSWSHRNWDTLTAEVSARPEIADYLSISAKRQATLKAEIADLERKIEELYQEVEAKTGLLMDAERQATKAVEDVIEAEHGPRVSPFKAGFSIDNEDLEELEEADDNEVDRRCLLLEFHGNCRHCGVRRTTENSGVPDEPGKVYARCQWCREHAGKSHCAHCGRPLVDGENYTCPECDVLALGKCGQCGNQLTEDEYGECKTCAPDCYGLGEPLTAEKAQEIADSLGLTFNFVERAKEAVA